MLSTFWNVEPVPYRFFFILKEDEFKGPCLLDDMVWHTSIIWADLRSEKSELEPYKQLTFTEQISFSMC